MSRDRGDPGRFPDRRDLLVAAGSAVGLFALGIGGTASKFLWPQGVVPEPRGDPLPTLLQATPTCGNDAEALAYEEGPFYTPNSPERSDLRIAGRGGRELVVRGQVRDQYCRPLPGAVIDFWQTDSDGDYDNVGYDFRGHVFADSEGRYELLTILPNPYYFENVWRASHIHLKAQGAGTKLLTSQLFFPIDPESNARHFGGFSPRLLSRLNDPNARVLEATFDLVLPA